MTVRGRKIIYYGVLSKSILQQLGWLPINAWFMVLSLMWFPCFTYHVRRFVRWNLLHIKRLKVLIVRLQPMTIHLELLIYFKLLISTAL